jgi:hypothetical protein
VICMITALRAEAEPLIEHYDLRRLRPQGLFSVYESPHLALVISGVGKISAAAAVAYLHTILGEPGATAWVNIGVAGHRLCPCGQGIIARRIIDAASGRNWLLSPPIALCTSNAPLITVDTPETEYPKNAMYDMEAAGFYFMARRCTTKERIQCYKVVSDNQRVSTTDVSFPEVSRLIADRLTDIECLIGGLQGAILNNAVGPLRSKR